MQQPSEQAADCVHDYIYLEDLPQDRFSELDLGSDHRRPQNFAPESVARTSEELCTYGVLQTSGTADRSGPERKYHGARASQEGSLGVVVVRHVHVVVVGQADPEVHLQPTDDHDLGDGRPGASVGHELD